MIKHGSLDRRYNGIGDCVSRIVKSEGVTALWRGNFANVARYFPAQAFNFALKDQFKRMFAVPKTAPYWKTFSANIASGALAGVSHLFLTYPLNYKYTYRRITGLRFTGYKDAIKTNGITYLYHDFFVPAVGNIVYRGLYFGLYDSLKPLVLRGPLEDSFFASFLLGWGVTIGAGFVSYPIDIIRYRMERVTYNSSLDCFSQILKQEGARALFKGAAGNSIRAVAGGGTLAVYDELQKIFYGKPAKAEDNM